MLTEHVPNLDNLDRISPQTPEKLSRVISQGDWRCDNDQLDQLITDMTATLIARNTSHIGMDFAEIVSVYELLFQNSVSRGSAKIHEFTYPGEDVKGNFRKGLIIAPHTLNNEIETVRQLFNSDLPVQEIKPIPVNNVLIHLHLDTVCPMPLPSEKYLAAFRTYKDPTTGLTYGLGANDMKATASLAPLLSDLLAEAGIEDAVYVITTDEESSGDFGGRRLTKCLLSNTLNIDWEPIAGSPGTYCPEIQPGLGITISPGRDLQDGDLEKLTTEIRKQYSAICNPMITRTNGHVSISVSGEELKRESEREVQELKVIAAQVFPKGHMYSMFENEGHKSNLNIKTRAALAKALIANFPLQNPHRQSSHITYSSLKKSALGKVSRESYMYGNFDFMLGMAHRNSDNTVVMGAHESGGGRHTPTEATLIAQQRMLLISTFGAVASLHRMLHLTDQSAIV
jgi:hypothetical protein